MRTTDKPFNITKKQVYEAYKAVKSNQGAAGVDKESIEQFAADLKGNLYKLWNRMSSGSYFPPPVRAVSIPKKSGGERILGVPTVADRVAQTVVKQLVEPDLDRIFLADSYGYRPMKSALASVATLSSFSALPPTRMAKRISSTGRPTKPRFSSSGHPFPRGASGPEASFQSPA